MKIEFFPISKSKPVLLIYDGTPSEVSALQAAFHSLSTGSNNEVSLHLLPGMETVGDCQLFARLGQQYGGVKTLNEENSFEWTLPAAQWEDIAEMIESFKKPWSGGHAFLDVKSKISPIISTGRGW